MARSPGCIHPIPSTPSGRPANELKSLRSYKFVFHMRARKSVKDVVFGILVRDKRGLDLFGWDMQTQGLAPLPAPGA